MEDYKQNMKELFQRYYTPVGSLAKVKHLSTSEVYNMFRGLLPSEPVSEHDVYEMMQELGHEPDLKILTQEVDVLDEEGEKTGEKKTVEIGRYFLWRVYEK